MSDNQEKRIQALEHSYSATISPEIRACAERLAAEEGIQADELVAGERGTSMADLLSKARTHLTALTAKRE